MLEIWDVVFIIYVNIVGGGGGRKDLQILGKNTKNLLQEFQSKGTKLSTVLGVLLLQPLNTAVYFFFGNDVSFQLGLQTLVSKAHS